MTIASFFSGIGGLEIGLEWAGLGPTVFQCERDPYAQRVLERHWPGVQRHDDITTLDPADIPDAEVWCGGFPCQDISVAGKGVGLSGERSGLWFAWFDLIRVVRPRIVVVENVAAFLGRGLGDVLGQLAEVGFDAEWSTLQAAEVGAPHRRDRVFVIAYLPDAVRDGSHGEQVGLEGGRIPPEPAHDGAEESLPDAQGRIWRRARAIGEQVRQAVAGVHGAQEPVADAERLRQLQPQGREQDKRRRAGDGGWWATEPDVGRVAHGVPARAHRLRCLGNSVVPQCAYVVGLRVRELMGFPTQARQPT